MFRKYIFRISLVLIIIHFVSAKLCSQEIEFLHFEYDSNYIEDLSEKLSLRIYGINKFNKFNIYDELTNLTLDYAPNNDWNFGVGVNYKWFGLGLAFNFPFINNDDEIYGNTQRLDFQLNIFTRKSLADVYFQFYQGFYIENPESYIDNWKIEQGYPIRPDIITVTLGASYLYVFNSKKFSARAVFVQTDLQKKSAGSFLAGGFASLYSMYADSSIIPNELKNEFDPLLLFNQISVSNIGLAFGYSHTFVMWKKLYFSITLVPGIALQSFNVSYNETDEIETGTRASFRMLSRTALLYNTEKWFTGFTFQDDGFNNGTNTQSKSSITYDVGVFRLFYGRRFDVKKK